jgi:hypothetical protein
LNRGKRHMKHGGAQRGRLLRAILTRRRSRDKHIRKRDNPVRIAVSHNRPKQQVIDSVERSFNDMFQQAGALPVKLTVDQRSWQGSVMTFQITARMGIMSTPIKGTVEVTDTELIVNADLGMLGRFVDDKTAEQMLGNKLKGLLN